MKIRTLLILSCATLNIISLFSATQAEKNNADKFMDVLEGDPASGIAPNIAEAKRLLAQGIDVEYRDINKFIPLHYAVAHGDVDLVKNLLNKPGAKNLINDHNNVKNMKPIQMAKNKEIKDALIAAGAK